MAHISEHGTYQSRPDSGQKYSEHPPSISPKFRVQINGFPILVHLAIVERQTRRERLSTPESCKALSNVNFLSVKKGQVPFSRFVFERHCQWSIFPAKQEFWRSKALLRALKQTTCRGTSLIRNHPSPGLFSRLIPGAMWWS